MNLFFLSLIVFSFYSKVLANPVDHLLGRYIKDFMLAPPATAPMDDPKKYRLGKLLFSEKKLSLMNDRSCQSCHDPTLGTSDALPFSFGTDGITNRNSPHLYNKGHEKIKLLFWDGRVSYNSRTKTYKTPEPHLNGANPKYDFITSKIENVLAMQALFPLVNPIEMRGEVNSSLTNLEVWKMIEIKISNDPKYSFWDQKIDIATIANALSYFQKIEFQVNDTPFDRYILGDLKALGPKEKNGALVFMEQGRCVRCHFGPLLSNQFLQNIGSPQTGEGANTDHDDEGQFALTRNSNHKYAFLNQPLRNVALSAPFFHSGAFTSIEEVINHYDDPKKSLANYNGITMLDTYESLYPSPIYVLKSRVLIEDKSKFINNILRFPLNLTDDQKRDLACFVKKSLTQQKFHSKLDLLECF